ncbi:MAG: sensor histidine kinase [Chitinophagaceae bacterium]|nr:sensor histidine kinase [Chitinophagaceae bacterium]
MNLSLKSRMVFLYLIFTFFIISVISIFAYNTTLFHLEKKEKEVLEDSLDYISERIEVRLKSLNEQFQQIFNEKRFIDIVLKYNAEGDAQANVYIQNDFSTYFSELVVKNQDIVHSVSIATDYKEIFSNQYNQIFNYKSFIETDYYKQAMEKKNKLLYVNPTDPKLPLALARSFYYLRDSSAGSNFNIVGFGSSQNSDYNVIALFIKRIYLQQIIDYASSRRNTMVLMTDESGRVIVQSQKLTDTPEFKSAEILGKVAPGSSGSYEYKDEGRSYVVTYKLMQNNGWHTIYIYDKSVLFKDTSGIRNSALVVFLLSVFLIIIISHFVSNTVVKPIRNLIRIMDNAGDDYRCAIFTTRYDDEIAHLSRTFNTMMKKINELILRIQQEEKAKREEEFKALQAQINPHFLYNTLDTIYWMAKTDNKDSIADIIADLAGFFRLSLNKGQEITTVANEIEHVRKYMCIQQVRMRNKFSFQISGDSHLMNLRIPKLILQPIVENSIIHGFNSISYQGVIDIRVEISAQSLLFTIEDNGKGMNEFHLTEWIENKDSKATIEEQAGYALRNVDQRIRLYGGEGYGLEITNKPQEGVKVILRLPLNPITEEGKSNG